MLVLQLLMDVRTCRLIQGPPDLPIPAFCIKKWPVVGDIMGKMQLQDAVHNALRRSVHWTSKVSGGASPVVKA